VTAVLAVIVVLVVGTVGFEFGTKHARAADWHSGVGYIGDREASIRVGGWVYGIEGSVPEWIDKSGALHSGSWPTCVGPVGTSKSIRFASVNVTAAGSSWNQVVMVDCRGS
jgi:hypothetical protein